MTYISRETLSSNFIYRVVNICSVDPVEEHTRYIC